MWKNAFKRIHRKRLLKVKKIRVKVWESKLTYKSQPNPNWKKTSAHSKTSISTLHIISGTHNQYCTCDLFRHELRQSPKGTRVCETWSTVKTGASEITKSCDL